MGSMEREKMGRRIGKMERMGRKKMRGKEWEKKVFEGKD